MYKVVAIALLLVVAAGCSTENPLCTDNYCVEGNIFLKSDLEEDQIYSVLPVDIDESALIAAFGKTTTDETTTDAGMEEQVLRTAVEWLERLNEQNDIPALSRDVLTFVIADGMVKTRIANNEPAPCVSLNNEQIGNKTYTCHGSVWVRFETTNQRTDIVVIDSTIKIGEICGIDPALIYRNTASTKYEHRSIMDMTIDGNRMLYVAEATFSRD